MDMHMRALAATYINYAGSEDKQQQLPEDTSNKGDTFNIEGSIVRGTTNKSYIIESIERERKPYVVYESNE